MSSDAGSTGSVAPPYPPGPARKARLWYAPIAGIIVLALAFATVLLTHLVPDSLGLVAWWIGTATLLLTVVAFGRGGRARTGPTVTGRIVAIVAAHEQATADLHASVWSVLNQRGVKVGEVHVVDAGSTHQPVQPFPHPRVRWHRTRDSDGHAAAGYVLDRLRREDWSFVLIMDGAHVLEERSLEHQLRAFWRQRVVATTGTVITRTVRRNPLIRIFELNVGASSALTAVWRSPAHLLRLVGGGPVLYRARIPFQHRHECDDERPLASYAAMEGQIVGVGEAIAWTLASARLRTSYRQLSVWSTASWRVVPLAVSDADRRREISARLTAMIHLVVVPAAVGCSLLSVAIEVGRNGLRWPPVALYAALYLLVRYAATGLYLSQRPEMTNRRKRWTWLLLTPVEAATNATVVLAIKYIALLGLCIRGWRTRRDHRIAPSPVPVVQPGTVYYSGYLPDGNGS